jgi:hypothetical protein
MQRWFQWTSKVGFALLTFCLLPWAINQLPSIKWVLEHLPYKDILVYHQNKLIILLVILCLTLLVLLEPRKKSSGENSPTKNRIDRLPSQKKMSFSEFFLPYDVNPETLAKNQKIKWNSLIRVSLVYLLAGMIIKYSSVHLPVLLIASGTLLVGSWAESRATQGLGAFAVECAVNLFQMVFPYSIY